MQSFSFYTEVAAGNIMNDDEYLMYVFFKHMYFSFAMGSGKAPLYSLCLYLKQLLFVFYFALARPFCLIAPLLLNICSCKFVSSSANR